MSRVIVKGLPKYLKEDRLKETFEKRLFEKHQSTDVKSLLTDVRIMKNRDGESRRFAFVGFRDEDDAFDCVRHFNGAYVDTSKIEVSMAKSFADPRVPQPMREKRREALKRLREREEELLADKKPKSDKKVGDKKHNIDAEIAKNKQLQEFINTMKPSSQITSWETVESAKETDANVGEGLDAETPSEGSNPLLSQALALKKNEGHVEQGVYKLPGNDSDDEYVSLNPMEKSKDENESQMMSLDMFETKPADDETDNMATDQAVSDSDWLKNRRVRIRDGEDGPASQNKAADNSNKAEDAPATRDLEPVEEEISEEERALAKIKETGRLFLRNILYTATEEDFRNLFAPYGKLEEVHVAIDTRTGQSKGFAYVLFKNPDDAVNAFIELDKQIFQGRLLHILPADSKKTHRLDEFDLKNLPLKKQRELKRKSSGAHQTFSWNSLYMNQDAVLGSVAAKLGMQKSDLIDAENSSSAVKQASFG